MADSENNVLITIIAHQTDGTEQDRTETVYPGRAFEKDGCHYVFYDEVDPDDGKVTRASLRIRRRHVDIRKKGVINTQMVFIPGQCTETEYQTPYGKFFLTVDTKCVDVRIKEKEVAVELDYRLSLGGAQSIRNRMNIKVAEL